MAVEQRDGHCETNCYYCSANDRSAESSGQSGSAKSTRNRTGSHDQSVSPTDRARKHEVRSRASIDAESQKILERVHLVNIGQTQQPERSKHQNADSGAEVPTIDGNTELEEYCSNPPCAAR